MADRNAPASFTFEEWRVEFNQLATDVGDITNIPSSINGVSTSDLVEAVTNLNTAVTSGFTVSDGSNTQAVGIGNTLTVNGTTNEIETAVSATDTLTIGLPNNVTIAGNLTVNGSLTGGSVAAEGFAIAMSIALG